MAGRNPKKKIKNATIVVDDIVNTFDLSTDEHFKETLKKNSNYREIVAKKIKQKVDSTHNYNSQINEKELISSGIKIQKQSQNDEKIKTSQNKNDTFLTESNHIQTDFEDFDNDIPDLFFYESEND